MLVKELPLTDAIMKLLEERVRVLPFQYNPMVHLSEGVEQMERAGILPFTLRPGSEFFDFLYYVMKPLPKHLDSRGEPLYQIAKGTRFYLQTRPDGEERWVDGKGASPELIREWQAEPLLRTALREGMEEIALEPMAIKTILDYGAVAFRSEQTAVGKSMWLYLAEMENTLDIPPLPEEHDTTQSSRWCSLQEFQRIGRPDHLMILTHVEQALTDYFTLLQKNR